MCIHISSAICLNVHVYVRKNDRERAIKRVPECTYTHIRAYVIV